MSDLSSLRVADADREQLVDELREHAGAGRLTSDELEQRVGEAYAAVHARAISTRCEPTCRSARRRSALALSKRKAPLRRRLLQEAGGVARRRRR